jgi:predicted nucleotidyltransferase component of viral defense system
VPRPERGSTPQGFREQVLQRLRNRARDERISPQRLQQRVAFERLLARLQGDSSWVLKGGFALELRYGWTYRPTRDIDLRFGDNVALNELLTTLRSAVASSGVQDGFAFEFGEVAQELQGAPGGSLRVAVTARLSGQQFAAFHIDLSLGDALVGEPDVLQGSDLLEFANIPPVRFPVYPVAQHLAEKLHAYTLPRDQPNTRVKDLVDMVAMAAIDEVHADALARSVEATFSARGTHPVPQSLPDPHVGLAAPIRQTRGRVADGADG